MNKFRCSDILDAGIYLTLLGGSATLAGLALTNNNWGPAIFVLLIFMLWRDSLRTYWDRD